MAHHGRYSGQRTTAGLLHEQPAPCLHVAESSSAGTTGHRHVTQSIMSSYAAPAWVHAPEEVADGGLTGANVLVEHLGPLDADEAQPRGRDRRPDHVRLAAARRTVQQHPCGGGIALLDPMRCGPPTAVSQVLQRGHQNL